MKVTDSLKLNLGCGYDKRPGYLNVDLNDFHSPDFVANIIEMNEFPSCHYEEIVAQDILEHILREHVRKALFEWNRLLKMDGTIFIRTTWVNGIIQLLELPEHRAVPVQEGLIHTLFGTQAYNGDYHLTGFTESLFRFYMWEAGFEIERMGLLHGAFLEAWGRKVRDHSYRHLVNDYSADATFISRAYDEILKRPPTKEELDKAATELPGKLARLNIVRQLLLSEESKARMIASAPKFPDKLCLFPRKPLVRRVAGKIARMLGISRLLKRSA